MTGQRAHTFRSSSGGPIAVRLTGPSPLDDIAIEGLLGAGTVELSHTDAANLRVALGLVLAWDGTEEASDAP